MKSNFRKVVLESIMEAAMLPADLFAAIVKAGYGASSKKFERTLSEVRDRREELMDDLVRRKNFYNLIHKLKKEGLIQKRKKGWIATVAGKLKLELLREKPSSGDYSYKKSNALTIVIFDIPEDKRSQRAWLRAALRNLGFEMIQRSVWSAKITLPRRFIADLNKLDILKYVGIFRAVNPGSLK